MACGMHSKNHTLLISKETTYGTPTTNYKDVGLIQNFTPTDKREVTIIHANGSREPQEIVNGKLDLKYDLEVFMQNGRLLEYALGSVTHAETTGDWVHTFDFADELPSMTIEDSYNGTTDVVFIRAGCKNIDSTFSIDKGGILTMKTSMTGKSVDTSTSSASAAIISTLKPLAFKHLTLSSGTAGSEVQIGKVQSFSFTLSNETEDLEEAGSVEICGAESKNIGLTFEFGVLFNDLTEYSKFLGGTSAQTNPAEFSFVINANNGVTLGSGRREFNAQLDGCTYEEAGKPVAVGDIILATFRGNATSLGSDLVSYTDSITSTLFS